MSDFELVYLLNPLVIATTGNGGVSNLGNTDGTTGTIAGQLVFVGSNNITLSQSLNGQSATISIYGGAGGGGGLTNIKVSAGTTSNLLSAITFSNSNGISFGLDASTITASVATSLTNFRLSAGTTSNLLSAVTFSNSNGVSFGINASTVTASIATSLTNINVSGGTTSNNLSAITFSNANGVTFGLDGSTLTASVAAVGGAQTGISGIIVSDATYTSGTVSFSNAGNITIASSVNGATQYIKLSGNAAQTNQSAIKAFGITNTGNTLGNTGVSTGIDWVIAASGAITASESTAPGGPNTAWLSVATQTNQTVGLYASSNTYLTSSGTVDARSLSFRGDKSITVGISAGEVLFSVGAYLTTAMASNRGTDFVQATAVFNGTNASGTIASNSWSVSVAAQTNQTLGAYFLGTTSGASSSSTWDARTISISGFGPMSLGASNGSMLVSLAGALYYPMYAHLGGV